MTRTLFKHLAIGDRFAFKDARDEDPDSPVFMRRGRNKYSNSDGAAFYTGLVVEVVLVERAADRRYTPLEEVLMAALRECIATMEGPLAGMRVIEQPLHAAKRAITTADLHFPAPRPPELTATPPAEISPAPMHWLLRQRA